MPELQRLTAEHLEATRTFELENRAYFARSLTDRGEAFYARYALYHQAMLDEQAAGAAAFFVLVDEDGSIIGRFNLYELRPGSARVGYRLAERVAGRGVATQAVAALCRRAASELGVSVLTAQAAVANRASQRVLEKSGFVATGPCDVAGQLGCEFLLRLAPAAA